MDFQEDQKHTADEQIQEGDSSRFAAAQGSIVTCAIVAIAVVAILFGIASAKGVIAPTLLAAFFAVILYAPYSFLQKKLHFGRGVALSLTIGLVLILGLGLGSILGIQFKAFSENTERYKNSITKLISAHGIDLSHIAILKNLSWDEEGGEEKVSEGDKVREDSVKKAEKEEKTEPREVRTAGNDAENSPLYNEAAEGFEGEEVSGEGADSAEEFPANNLSEVAEKAAHDNVSRALDFFTMFGAKIVGMASLAFMIMILVIFMLLEAVRLPEKIKGAIGEIGNDRLRAIAHDIQHYMRIKTEVSLIVGIFVAVFLFFLHVPYCLLWGVIAFLFNYVPNIGSVVASIPPIVLAFAEQGFVIGFIAVIGFVVINCVMGYVFEPRWLGKGLDLSPLIVIISLMGWCALLGSTGLFLAPLLGVICKIILQQFPETEWLALLMADGVNNRSEPEKNNSQGEKTLS